MTQKIAVAVIHGVGNQTEDFADRVIDSIQGRCRPVCGDDIIIRPVYWSPVVQHAEDEMRRRLYKGGQMRFNKARGVMIDLVADGIAYQPTEHGRYAYDHIHRIFAQTLHTLAEEAGPKAPLCVVAHSLGTIIASNYIYDLQVHFSHQQIIPETIAEVMGDTPLERGETLSLLYTLGSPLALWSLRYTEFGRPIDFPAPQLYRHYPNLPTEWINFYDADDIIGFPLKTLNAEYERIVTADREVNVGGLLEQWNPLSHLGYWTDKDIVEPIAESLTRVWQTLNSVFGYAR